LVTCRSYNLNGDPKSALAALAYLGIAVKRFVAKNVCYGICYDWEMHGQLGDKSLSLSLIWQGIDIYLRVRVAKGGISPPREAPSMNLSPQG
jgi:pyrimidine-specific ribonucleoside hydrolase